MIRGIQWMTVGLFLLAACGGGNEDKVRGTQLVAGDNLKLEDISADGSTIAYSDAVEDIFIVSANGGDPIKIAINVDDAKFKGNILVLFSDIDDINDTASMQFVTPGSTTPTAAVENVKINSVRASDDSNHLFFEAVTSVINDVTISATFLDNNVIIPDAEQVRGRFTADNQFLVVSFNPPAGVESGILVVPLNGGASFELPGCDNGCSSRFQVSNTGQQIVFAANENVDTGDLTVIDASGQNALELAGGASDNGFVIAKDSDTLVFVDSQSTLSTIGLDGSGLTSLGTQGVVDIIEANATAIAYATNVDADGLADLSIVGADGSGEAALGELAVSEGFSRDNAFFLFLDNVNAADKLGNLKFTSTAAVSVEQIAGLVDKASFINNSSVIFLDDNDLLQSVDLNENQPEVFEDSVNKFELIKNANGEATQVVFTVPGGKAAGVYIEEL